MGLVILCLSSLMLFPLYSDYTGRVRVSQVLIGLNPAKDVVGEILEKNSDEKIAVNAEALIPGDMGTIPGRPENRLTITYRNISERREGCGFLLIAEGAFCLDIPHRERKSGIVLSNKRAIIKRYPHELSPLRSA